jgi:hypothetical protein
VCSVAEDQDHQSAECDHESDGDAVTVVVEHPWIVREKDAHDQGDYAQREDVDSGLDR